MRIIYCCCKNVKCLRNESVGKIEIKPTYLHRYSKSNLQFCNFFLRYPDRFFQNWVEFVSWKNSFLWKLKHFVCEKFRPKKVFISLQKSENFSFMSSWKNFFSLFFSILEKWELYCGRQKTPSLSLFLSLSLSLSPILTLKLALT